MAWASPICASLKEQAVEARARDPALMPALDAALDRLAAAGVGRDARRRASIPTASRCCAKAHVKYDGTDAPLVVAYGTLRRDRRQLRGGAPAALRLRHAGEAARRRGGVGRDRRRHRRGRGPGLSPCRRRRRRADAAGARRALHRRRASIRRRSSTATRCMPGQAVDGPAIIREATATTVVEPGWRARARSPALSRARARRAAPRAAAPSAPASIR